MCWFGVRPASSGRRVRSTISSSSVPSPAAPGRDGAWVRAAAASASASWKVSAGIGFFARSYIVCSSATARSACGFGPSTRNDSLRRVMLTSSAGGRFPEGRPAPPVQRPDDWSRPRPRHEGSVWSRAVFAPPAGTGRDDLLVLYIERVCTTDEVFLNGHRIHSGGRLTEPLAR